MKIRPKIENMVKRMKIRPKVVNMAKILLENAVLYIWPIIFWSNLVRLS